MNELVSKGALGFREASGCGLEAVLVPVSDLGTGAIGGETSRSWLGLGRWTPAGRCAIPSSGRSGAVGGAGSCRDSPALGAGRGVPRRVGRRAEGDDVIAWWACVRRVTSC